jgi:dihydroorotase
VTGASEISETVLIRGARLIDPVRGWDRAGDLLMGGGVILAAGDVAPEQVPLGCQVIDGRGLVASPGFIDLHCHLREPGYEYKETIASGSQAAARGGFTTLCCMPNTDPPIDSQPVVEFIHARAASEAAVRIFPIGCVTKGRKGRQLADMEELANSGVVAFSDDGDPVEDPNLMRLALTYSYDLGLPVTNHCQDLSLSCNGVMAEGAVATRLGLPGIPAAAEEAMIARDISLAEMTNGRLHLAHLSTAGSVALLRQAKAMNLRVTAEVCPHHLTVTDQWVMGARGLAGASASPYAYDTATKVYPPLRTQHDADVLVEALAEGTIDAIATDHAPHDGASKQVTYEDASFGISVLETALGSCLQLVHQDRLSLPGLVARLTSGPAAVIGERFAPFASLQPGTPADVALFDPDREWTVDARSFASKGKNTPLDGTTLKGLVQASFVAGRPAFLAPDLILHT